MGRLRRGEQKNSRHGEKHKNDPRSSESHGLFYSHGSISVNNGIHGASAGDQDKLVSLHSKKNCYQSFQKILFTLSDLLMRDIANNKRVNNRSLAFFSFGLRASFGIRHSCFVISSALVLTLMAKPTQAQSPNITGKWNVEVSFGAGGQHSLRFDAQGGGKGTFVLTDPIAKAWGVDKPSEAKWTRGEASSLTFSGPMEFPIGNVGRDAGTLTFKGKFETPDSIRGEVEFFPLVGERPPKHGTFKAVREKG